MNLPRNALIINKSNLSKNHRKEIQRWRNLLNEEVRILKKIIRKPKLGCKLLEVYIYIDFTVGIPFVQIY